MPKRDGKTITLGSGKVYCLAATDTMPTVATLCVAANQLGYVKNGATITYTEETYEEKDDLGYVSKIITTKEDASMKLGMITWNGATLKKLLDRCDVTEDTETGVRTTKIGGAGNAQGVYYAIAFVHEDATDGDVTVLIKGRNTAGATLTFAPENGTILEPEFKAMPHDEDGTLIELIEEIPTANAGEDEDGDGTP